METHNLLPNTHLRGRRARGSNVTIHALVEKIYTAWKYKEVATVLFLNIIGVFNNVSYERLIYNLKKRRVSTDIIKYLTSFISDRSIELRLPN